MFRLAFSVVTHFFTCICLALILKRSLKSSDLETRYAACRKTAETIIRKMHVRIIASGLENIPECGCFIMPNHQGRFDGLPVMNTHESPMTYMVDKERSDISIEEHFMNLCNALRIERNNPRQAMEVFREASLRALEGEHICIFPEGGYKDNKNNLQEFHTGPFHFLRTNPVPIVPVCLFDTWKVFNYEKLSHSLRRVTCQIHYLMPIMPEEYKGLSKRETAELVKARIAEKLKEIKEK